MGVNESSQCELWALGGAALLREHHRKPEEIEARNSDG
jgi:hypothetical protein